MALVIVQAPPLSAERKKRIGEIILRALHQEGIPAAATVVLFRPEEGDLYLEGGVLHEARRPAPPVQEESSPAPLRPRIPEEPVSAPLEFLPPKALAKPRSRPGKAERAALKQKLVQALQVDGALSSFEAQARLELKDCDWAPNTLRRFFTELEEEGLITKQGQKRGTRYVWKGIVQAASPALPPVRLVKKTDDGEA